ncbi:MAG: hypothetical protein VR72_08515 [Clostridiaceae bacterium BRH_c20a]|nr:MAG: hypothetical protein VR72_08515 [Clostridiaceae bacterium BRH_c20a]
MDNIQILEAFLEYKIKLRKSKLTIKCYNSILRRLCNDIEKPIESLSCDDIKKWLDENYAKKNPNTYNHCYSVLKSFFKYCLINKLINKIPLKIRWRKKKKQTLPKYLENGQHAQFRELVEKQPIRERVAMTLIDDTGLRRAEVVRINCKDVDLKNRTIKVRCKGNKERSVFFTPKTAIFLEKYLGNKNEDEPLFLNNDDKRLSDRSIYNFVSELLKKVGCENNYGVHRLRHTFAMNLLIRSNNIKVVADLLGHKYIKTTKIYTKLPTDEMLYKYDQLMG